MVILSRAVLPNYALGSVILPKEVVICPFSAKHNLLLNPHIVIQQRRYLSILLPEKLFIDPGHASPKETSNQQLCQVNSNNLVAKLTVGKISSSRFNALSCGYWGREFVKTGENLQGKKPYSMPIPIRNVGDNNQPRNLQSKMTFCQF